MVQSHKESSVTEVCTREEQDLIVAWANSCYQSFKRNGTGRQYAHLRDRQDAPSCVWDIKARVVERENLHGALETKVILPDLVSYIVAGGKVHPHRDPNLRDLWHTRFNVIVQIPEEGGEPVYAGEQIPWQERQYVRCVAGRDLHECRKVVGAKARIVLSYGFQLPADALV